MKQFEYKGLVLFDIDGTIIGSNEPTAHDEAFCKGLYEVFGVDATIHMIEHHGMLDPQIIHDLAVATHVHKDDIHENIPKVCDAMVEYYQNVAPFVPIKPFADIDKTMLNLTQRGYLLGLTTGNLEPIAHLKLGSAGVDHHFKLGGFGSDVMGGGVRADLANKAIEKAVADFSFVRDADNIHLVGDTPHDAQAALQANVNGICVATGYYNEEELKAAGAGKTISTMANILHLLP